MLHLDPTDEERDKLLRVPHPSANGLAVEIVHTDRYAYRSMLREREGLVTRILAKAEEREATAVA